MEILLDLNGRLTGGKEISTVEMLKKIDPVGPFIKKYENQKFLRRSFESEFRIHCFNYKLLLFESITRILQTVNCRMEMQRENEKSEETYDTEKESQEGTESIEAEEEEESYYEDEDESMTSS